MKKPKSAKILVQKPYTIHPDYHFPMMERLVTEKGFTSHSEVVRRGIESIYEHYFPPYKQATPLQEKKLERINKEKFLSDATPEQLAEHYHAPIRTAASGLQDVRAGDKVAFFFHPAPQANYPTPVLLSKIRSYVNQFPEDVEIHLAKLKSVGPLEPLLLEGKQYDSNWGFTCTL